MSQLLARHAGTAQPPKEEQLQLQRQQRHVDNRRLENLNLRDVERGLRQDRAEQEARLTLR